jgi:N,N'-diacetyllegionaminate synthase
MELFGKDLDKDLAVIAEIGVNHEGDVETASRLIKLASQSGADAVKFQSYTPARYASASDPARLERVSGFSLSEEEHLRLASEATALGTPMFSTPLSEDIVPFLADNFPAIKIASGDLTFEPVIRAAAATGKPVILSTGLGSIEEVDQAVAWFRDEVGQEDIRDHLIVMQCVSAYPTPIEEANVRSAVFLAERYGTHIGYSNHVIGLDASLAAVALGASVIEVHFTDNKHDRDFRDHELSYDPEDFASFVAQATRIRQSLGNYDKVIVPSELGNRDAVRKGIVAAQEISEGTVLTRQMLMFARPATEIPASEINIVVGKTLQKTVSPGEMIPRSSLN